ncbi:MAG: hypothetical protein KKH80_03205 [Candidatus Omnitrophica bacterium]|nr:hypothetical protein [Candidatus Omnitrophota bacterium]
MNKKLLIILALLALLVVVMFSKNLIAKTALSAGVKAITGLNLSMKSMNVEIFKTLIGIKELKLYNPSGFPDKLMIEMPEIYIDYDLGSFLGGRAHFEEIRLNIKEFFVVKNENGELNLNSLKIVKAGKEGLPKEEKKEAAGMPELKIDMLQLKIGKVIYKDYSAGRAPKIR